MKTRVTKTPLEGLVVINIDYFRDERGFFKVQLLVRLLEIQK